MKICNILPRKIILPILTASAIAFPVKTAEECAARMASDIPISMVYNSNKIQPRDLDGLKIVADTNFEGGISHRFDDESIQKLKKRILMPDSLLEYKLPIENTSNVYLEPFGYFFANRPYGNKTRPHLGLDIFASQFSRKPKKPVLIKAPVDGVIISNKRARESDNSISNCVVLLGRDGRRYAFDHMARPNDYKDSVPMPTVGTIMKAGDSIGYVGSTGETAMWHLHLTVMTDEEAEAQNASDAWRNLASRIKYCELRGQVNPLDREKAGPIADSLCKYGGAKPGAVGEFKL